jgi:transposase
MPQGSEATSSKKQEVTPVKKRPYRAEPVKQINLEPLKKAAEAGRLVVGIDIAKRHMKAGFMNERRENLATVKWEHPEGTQELTELLEQLPATSLEIVVEPSGTYGHALMHLLHVRWKVFLVSGKRTHDAAEIYDGVPSTHDGKCAQIIARLHLEGASRRWVPEPEERRTLKAGASTLERYQKRYLENVNRIEGQLARVWPELFGLIDLTGAAILALLERYPGPAAVQKDARGAKELMSRAGRKFLVEEKINAVIASARTSIGVDLNAAERYALSDLARDTRVAREQKQEAEAKLRELGAENEIVKRLAPMTGMITAIMLLALAGDVHAYPSAGAYLKALGLNLREHSSGEGKIGKLRITKRGSPITRKYLFLLALRMVNSNPIVEAWYAKKVQRDGGKVKMKAIMAVMRKLAKAIWNVGRGASFDAAKLFDVRLLDVRQEPALQVA